MARQFILIPPLETEPAVKDDYDVTINDYDPCFQCTCTYGENDFSCNCSCHGNRKWH